MIASKLARSLTTARRAGVRLSASPLSASATSTPRRHMSDEHHGPEDNWPQNESEKRRLWGYGTATLVMFLYFAYKIRGPGTAQQKQTVTTVTTAHK